MEKNVMLSAAGGRSPPAESKHPYVFPSLERARTV